MKPADLISKFTPDKLPWGYLFLTLLLSLLLFYCSLARILPFDLAWDMDILTVNDALLINSHQYPLHIDHPKFGMHLLSSKALELGRYFNLISVADFTELRMSPSPLLCIAELTIYLRGVEAVMIWLTLVLALWLLWLLFPRHRPLHMLSLPLFALQPALLFCSMAMRTEAYSVFFVLLGLLLFTGHYQKAFRQGRLLPELLAWVLGGLCFGIAVLTKLQAILASPFFLLVCFYLYSRAAASESETETPAELPAGLRRAIPLLLAVSLLLGGLLGWLAWRHQTLPGASPFLIPLNDFFKGDLSLIQLLGHLKLQMLWLLLLGSSLFLPLLARIRPLHPWRRFFQLYPLFWSSVLAAFALPLLTYLGQPGGLNRGWTYLLQMAQSCFWTDISASTSSSAGTFLPTLTYLLSHDPAYILLALGALLIAVYTLLIQPRDRRLQASALLIFAAGVVILLLGSRANYMFRDAIWFRFLGCLSILILVHQLWPLLKAQRLLQSLLVLCLLIPAFGQIGALSFNLDQIAQYYSKFKLLQNRPLVTAFFAKAGMDWPRTMIAAYGPKIHPPDESEKDVLRRAVEQGRLLEPLHRLADLNFVDQKLPVRALGLAEPKFPVWSDGKQWARFKQLAPHLRGSLLVNPAAIPAAPGHAGLGEPRAIYPVWDSDLLFCVSAADYQRLFQVSPTDSGTPLQVALAGQTIDYYPIQMTGDYESPVIPRFITYTHRFALSWFKSFKYPPFFLVRNGNAWGPDYPDWFNLEAFLRTNGQDPALLE